MEAIAPSGAIERSGIFDYPELPSAGYTCERFKLDSSNYLEWTEHIAPRIEAMQQEAWPIQRQRHSRENLEAALGEDSTVAVLLRDAAGEIVGFSYAIPEELLQKYDQYPSIGENTAHQMMIVIDRRFRGIGLMPLLMKTQLDEVAKHPKYKYMVAEYNANTGLIGGHEVMEGFASNILRRTSLWWPARIVTTHEIYTDLYGKQEFTVFELNKPNETESTLPQGYLVQVA